MTEVLVPVVETAAIDASAAAGPVAVRSGNTESRPRRRAQRA